MGKTTVVSTAAGTPSVKRPLPPPGNGVKKAVVRRKPHQLYKSTLKGLGYRVRVTRLKMATILPLVSAMWLDTIADILLGASALVHSNKKTTIKAHHITQVIAARTRGLYGADAD